MSQAKTSYTAGQLFYKLSDKRRLRNVLGPEGRLTKIKKTLTALLKYERIEVNYQRGDEVRGYAERLISEAIRHGPENKETMDLANFYILEKQLIHKLFKVLVPRYQDYSFTYTKMYRLPKAEVFERENTFSRGILELRGNIFPSLVQKNPPEHNLLHNVLLTEARKEFNKEKYKNITDIEQNLSIKE